MCCSEGSQMEKAPVIMLFGMTFKEDMRQQRILCLSGPSYISSAKERLAGYHQALYEAGIPLCPELIHEVQPVGEDLKEILTDSFALPGGFTAVFAFSDMIAWETIYQLNELGKKFLKIYRW